MCVCAGGYDASYDRNNARIGVYVQMIMIHSMGKKEKMKKRIRTVFIYANGHDSSYNGNTGRDVFINAGNPVSLFGITIPELYIYLHS